MDIEKYRLAVRKKVCERCVDARSDGQCGLREPLQCGINRYMDRIVHAVQSVHSDKLADYLPALRSEVCSHCDNQSVEGICEFRNKVSCGLDRFLELVVEVVEETDAS